MESLWQDLRYAARTLRRSPVFTAVAVLTLALGIGANTAVFSLVNAALFREIDAPEPSRLVWLVGTNDRNQSRFRSLSFPEYVQHRDRDSIYTGLTTYQDMSLALGSGGEPERISGLVVTGNYFTVLGVRPQLGRTFAPEEDAEPGAHPVVVLGDAIWRRRFAADRDIVSKTIVLNGRNFAVIGVAPRGFTGVDLGQQCEVFVPMAMLDVVWSENRGSLADWNAGWLRAIGRLAPGVSIEEARARTRVTGSQIATGFPEAMRGTSASIEPLAGGLDPNNRREGVPIFLLLMAVPGMVLLIACANGANLLLSRAASRRREIAVRLALGATRARLTRMMMAESLLLGLMSGGLGLLSSFWIVDAISVIGNVPAEITGVVKPDGLVLAFTMALALLTGLVFGLVPALGATRPAVVPALKEDGIAGARFHRSRLMSAFVVTQVAVSLVLLVTAGLFLRTLAKATRVDTGFDTRNGLALSFDLGLLGYTPERRTVFYEQLVERTTALPGVAQASLTSNLPLSSRMYNSEVLPEGQEPNPASAGPNSGRAAGYTTSLATLWPNYFRTMGVQILAGRDFTDRDNATAPGVAIVNERLAERLWSGQSPIGKRLRFTEGDEPLLEVVGVAKNGKYDELTESPRSFIFLPQRQQARIGSDMTLLVRTTADPAAMIPSLRALIRDMEPNLPLFGLRTLEEHVLLRLDKERAATALLGAFGALALLLATLGLYGVMAYAVTQRTREISIRIALGAARREVLSLVMRDGLRLAAFGIVIGLALAAAVTRVIQRFLFGVTPTDLATFVAVAALLTGVAALASFLPARRAAAVDPMVALRAE